MVPTDINQADTGAPGATTALLARLRALDIRLMLDGDRLRVSAPKGALTSELQSEIGACKDAIIAILRRAKADRPVKAIERGETLPISHAQERIWFFEQLEPGTSTFNVTATFRALGPLDSAVLDLAVASLVEQHESLRCAFPAVNGRPVVRLVTPRGPYVRALDLRGADRGVETATAHAAAFAEEPFDLVNGPLLRLLVARVSDDEAFVTLVMHHIVSDGWSFSLVVKTLGDAYTIASRGQQPELPRLPIQYADYAAWQREWLAAGEEDRQLEYWKRRLAGPLPLLELPTDAPRRRERTYRAGIVNAEVSPDLQGGLRKRLEAKGASWYSTLLSAFGVLMARHGGVSDLIVGSPVAGRARTEFEPLIGMFINTLPIRLEIPSEQPFAELATQVHARVLEGFDHADVPFAKLVEALQPERSLAHTPIFQVLFNMLPPATGESLAWGDVELEQWGSPAMWAKFDVTAYALERRGGTLLHFVYNADLFADARMRDVADQYLAFLEQVARDPDVAVGQYDLVTETARAELPRATLPLDGQRGGDLVTPILTLAHQAPGRLALTTLDRTVSYADVARESARLAAELRAAGVGPNDVVGIHARRDVALVPALIGVLRAEAAFAILDPSYPPSRLADAVRTARLAAWIDLIDAGPRHPHVEEALAAQHLKHRTVFVPQPLAEDATPYAPAPGMPLDPDTLAYVAFTSGTTGGLKAVTGTQRPVSHFLDWYKSTFALGENDRFALLAGLSHDPLLRDVFTPLGLGATLCIPSPDVLGDPALLSNWLRHEAVSVVHWTPTLAALATRRGEATVLPDMRLVCFGGEPLTRTVVEQVHRCCPSARLVNFYGATETPQAMGWFEVPVEDQARWAATCDPLPVGRGIGDVHLLVLNSSDRLCGIGELGEIVVRTPYLTSGYMESAAAPGGRFAANPLTGVPSDRAYRTGDLGRYGADGLVEFAGRRDAQVKIRGFRIELGAVEAAIKEIAEIRDVAVVAQQGESGDSRLVAYCVTAGQPEMLGGLRRRLMERLPEYMVPAAFVHLDALPVTPNGKLDVRALPKPSVGDASPRHADAGPHDGLEMRLFRIWQETLGVPAVSRSDNFFEVGGHSLLAVELFARIERELGRNLPIALIFQAPTLDALSRLLRQKEWAPTWRSLVPIQPKGARTPIFALPGIGGNVVCYHQLAELLGPNQPLYGLQARGLDGSTPPFESIVEAAAHHVSEIRTVQPQGPYRFIGLCIGGLIAYEMAHQLRAAGEQVDLLVMADTFPSSPIRALRGSKRFGAVAKVFRLVTGRLRMYASGLRAIPLREWPAFVKRKLSRVKVMVEGSSAAAPLAGARLEFLTDVIERANLRAASRYRAGRFDGRIVFFLATGRPVPHMLDNRQRWKSLTRGVTYHHLPTADSGTMLSEPHVHVFAREVIAHIAHADAPADHGAEHEAAAGPPGVMRADSIAKPADLR